MWHQQFSIFFGVCLLVVGFNQWLWEATSSNEMWVQHKIRREIIETFFLLLILIVLKIRWRNFLSVFNFSSLLLSALEYFTKNNINFLFFIFHLPVWGFLSFFFMEMNWKVVSFELRTCAKITEGLSSSSLFLLAAGFFFHFIWFKLSSSVRLKNYCSK